MTEHTLVDACQTRLRQRLPGANIWKIADKFTVDQPDMEIAWSGQTTKIEFKYIRKGVDIHDELGIGQQLTCQRYEEATGLCWIVAWYAPDIRRAIKEAHTRIYRPSVLFNRNQHAVMELSRIDPSALPRAVWERGCVAVAGFDHEAVVSMIKHTH